MAPHTRLLPQNASKLMLAAAETNDPFARLADRYDGITLAYRNTPPKFMPFLVWQYGLGELTPYLPNLNDLVSEGVRWQRVRGTPDAIRRGLGWIGYAGSIEEEPARRHKWNRFQLHLDRVRDADTPDLMRIDGIVSLSPPARSKFYRGFRGYDIRAQETSLNRLSQSLLSSHSGVRIEPNKAKWSFGRVHLADVTLSEAELASLGAWIPPVPEGDAWRDAHYRWSLAHIQWAISVAIARRRAMAEAMMGSSVYVCFHRTDKSVIGYRKAILRPVRSSSDGEYPIGNTRWKVDPANPSAILVSARTGFGDGAGDTATSMMLAFNPDLSPGTSPGKLWLSASEAGGGTAIATANIVLPFGLTSREFCRFILRF